VLARSSLQRDGAAAAERHDHRAAPRGQQPQLPFEEGGCSPAPLSNETALLLQSVMTTVQRLVDGNHSLEKVGARPLLSLSPGKGFQHKRSSSHATVPLLDASPHPQGERPAPVVGPPPLSG
jgi:hypothetical protein